MYAPRRTACPADPPVVQNTIRFTKNVAVDITPSAGVGRVTPNSLASGMSGITTGLVRIQSVKVWGDSAITTGGDISSLTVKLVGTPLTTWTDTGVPGHTRPHLAWQFGLGVQSTWYLVSDATTLLATISGGLGTGDNWHVQAVLEYLGN